MSEHESNFWTMYSSLWDRGELSGDVPLLAICNPEVDWYDPEMIKDSGFVPTNEYSPPVVIPFAGNGAGDWWCYFEREQSHGVALLWHDDSMALQYAPNLQLFLFRQTVEALASYEVAGSQRSAERADDLRLLLSGVDRVARELPDDMAATLRSFLKGQPRTWEESNSNPKRAPTSFVGFLEPSDVDNIVQDACKEWTNCVLNGRFRYC